MRDFRGAMQGRADKGLFITTGSFTRDAVKEATRDGAPPIDLIDGEQLIDMLKNLELGVKEVIKKDYEVDRDWFEKI
jgi:restriction system protein